MMFATDKHGKIWLDGWKLSISGQLQAVDQNNVPTGKTYGLLGFTRRGRVRFVNLTIRRPGLPLPSRN